MNKCSRLVCKICNTYQITLQHQIKNSDRLYLHTCQVKTSCSKGMIQTNAVNKPKFSMNNKWLALSFQEVKNDQLCEYYTIVNVQEVINDSSSVNKTLALSIKCNLEIYIPLQQMP